MNYQKYIDLGFERVEMDCSVEYEQTGYTGFALTKKVTDNISIEATSGHLDKPKMYIKKANSESHHVIDITPQAVVDLLTPKEDNQYKAC